MKRIKSKLFKKKIINALKGDGFTAVMIKKCSDEDLMHNFATLLLMNGINSINMPGSVMNEYNLYETIPIALKEKYLAVK